MERGGKWHIAGNWYDEKDRHSEQVVGACREVEEKSSEDEYHREVKGKISGND